MKTGLTVNIFWMRYNLKHIFLENHVNTLVKVSKDFLSMRKACLKEITRIEVKADFLTVLNPLHVSK